MPEGVEGVGATSPEDVGRLMIPLAERTMRAQITASRPWAKMASASSLVSGRARSNLNIWSGVVPTGPIIHISQHCTSSLVIFVGIFHSLRRLKNYHKFYLFYAGKINS